MGRVMEARDTMESGKLGSLRPLRAAQRAAVKLLSRTDANRRHIQTPDETVCELVLADVTPPSQRNACSSCISLPDVAEIDWIVSEVLPLRLCSQPFFVNNALVHFREGPSGLQC
jgi:hypothetical protein